MAGFTSTASIAEKEISTAAAKDHQQAAVHVDRIFDELEELRELICLDPALDDERKILGEGITAIHGAIRQTRGEIATLHAKAVRGREFNRATDELDAVVSDTEAATETILAAAETIDALSLDLLRNAAPEDVAKIEEIRSRSISIFEACNFQDITGQRISKVVRTLKFIEDRIATMLAIWRDIEGFDDADIAVDERVGDAALLNGPALADEENVVSQDDIDSLFS